jgi:hypothetical protein
LSRFGSKGYPLRETHGVQVVRNGMLHSLITKLLPWVHPKNTAGGLFDLRLLKGE